MTSYNELFRDRTKELALAIISTYSKVPYSDAFSVIRKQIIRSATSTAANYRAVGRARSNKERYAKLCIVIEEADETLFWLEITESLGYLEKESLGKMKIMTEEIVKVISAYRKKLNG